jgi:hypothetical protein
MPQIDIDFNVYSNPYYISVVDASIWGVIESQPSIIEITLPGDSSPVTHYFDKGKVNIFNSHNLYNDCVDCGNVNKNTLPDGIYVIRVVGSPSSYDKERYYLKTDLTQMEVDKLYIDSYHNSSRENVLTRMTEIEFLLKAAESHVRYGSIREARMIFEQAEALVSKLRDCKTC